MVGKVVICLGNGRRCFSYFGDFNRKKEQFKRQGLVSEIHEINFFWKIRKIVETFWKVRKIHEKFPMLENLKIGSFLDDSFYSDSFHPFLDSFFLVAHTHFSIAEYAAQHTINSSIYYEQRAALLL